MLKLRFKNNKHNAVWLVEPKVSIGRGSDNDLVIDGNEIADHHADILVKHENLTLVNVAGGQGVFVNRKPVDKTAALKLNDEVMVGKTVLQVVDPKAEIAAAPKAKVSTGSENTGWALKPNHSALANRIFNIKNETVIGRSNDCDITIAAAHLSRRHVKLMVQEGLLYVKDLGSANGTYLNGERVSEARVKRGDELRFDTLCFGVIGPTEDLDKTTIRRIDRGQDGVPTSAVAAAKAAHAKKSPRVAGGARPVGNEPIAGQVREGTMTSEDSGGKSKTLWLLGILILLGVGAALAYQQGLLDPFLQ